MKHKILIVDDNPLNVDTLIATLGDDYEITVALDGATALNLLKHNDLPSLVLLDVIMPNIDGYEVCQRIKTDERTQGISIIFLTALTDVADQEKGLSIGAVDYITKPFNPSIVRARVRSQLKLKQYRDHLEDLVAEKTEQLLDAQEAIIASMAIMAEHRDPETGNHIHRTKSYVQALANAMSIQMPDVLTPQFVDMLCRAAPLHDIGKVAIPDEILLKPGRLTDEEAKIMHDHTVCGADTIRRTEAIVGSNPLLHLAMEIAEYHHEKWDGSGYPHGLEGERIPLSSRLMAIADVYDALISKRPYKPAFSHDETVKIILEGDNYTKPHHFDPQILSCFSLIHNQFNVIATTFGDN